MRYTTAIDGGGRVATHALLGVGTRSALAVRPMTLTYRRRPQHVTPCQSQKIDVNTGGLRILGDGSLHDGPGGSQSAAVTLLGAREPAEARDST